MLDDHAHVMQVKLCKANTRGVTAPPPYKNLIPRFARPTILGKRRDKLLVNNLLFPTWHLVHYDCSTPPYRT